MLSYSLMVALGIAVCWSMISCYRAGLRDGKGDPPAPLFRVKKGKVETDARLDAVLDNIDSYDGTSAGQKEVPI